jgi:hypothetical protein
MSKQTTVVPNFWSVYNAINFKRFSKTREFTDVNSGKVMSYSFIAEERVKQNFILSLVSMLLWLSPAFLIAIITVIYAKLNFIAFPIGILALVGYHFAGMYYLIRGPIIEYHEEKKKK